MSLSLPLAGLNIVVTRPRAQAEELTRLIAAQGATPLLFPLLEIEAVPEDADWQAQFAHLAQTDLAIFISPNAVHYGLPALRRAGDLPHALKFACVGAGSARALREQGVTQVIAPAQRFDSEGLLALPELQQVGGWRVMILRGDGGRELLGDTLRARGAVVDYVTCYRRVKPALDVGALLASRPDAITLTSSEALRHLWQAAQPAQRSQLAALPLLLAHARIAQEARQQGWLEVVVTAAGDDGLLSGLIAWALGKRDSRL